MFRQDIDIVVIINSFNRFLLLTQSIDALYSWILTSNFKDRIAVIVYEAGSTDGSLEWLTQKATESITPLEIILPSVNDDTSFSAGLNSAVSFAESKFSSLDYLLFYETDNQIVSEKPLMDALSQLQSRNNLAACGFTVRKHNGQPAGVGMPFPRLLNFAVGQNLASLLQLEKISFRWEAGIDDVAFSELDIVFTSPLLVKLKAWKESGGMDAKLFPFSDCDIDWAHKLSILRWRMGVVRTDAVIHDNREVFSNWSKSRSQQFHRARLRYFRRYKPNLIFTIWPFILMVRHLFELLITKCMIHEPVRRKQLSEQFLTLLKSCVNKYE